jgi:hypothetical protein
MLSEHDDMAKMQRPAVLQAHANELADLDGDIDNPLEWPAGSPVGRCASSVQTEITSEPPRSRYPSQSRPMMREMSLRASRSTSHHGFSSPKAVCTPKSRGNISVARRAPWCVRPQLLLCLVGRPSARLVRSMLWLADVDSIEALQSHQGDPPRRLALRVGSVAVRHPPDGQRAGSDPRPGLEQKPGDPSDDRLLQHHLRVGDCRRAGHA